jgi:hypothetical protein
MNEQKLNEKKERLGERETKNGKRKNIRKEERDHYEKG